MISNIVISQGTEYMATCDNLDLLTLLIKCPMFDPMYPNYVLSPDWDLIEEIFQCTQTMGLQAKYVHVKGHQDENHPYAEFDLPAQLNVDTDTLACQYLKTDQNVHHIAPILNSTAAHLDINGITKTSHLKEAVRFTSTAQALKDHITC